MRADRLAPNEFDLQPPRHDNRRGHRIPSVGGRSANPPSEPIRRPRSLTPAGGPRLPSPAPVCQHNLASEMLRCAATGAPPRVPASATRQTRGMLRGGRVIYDVETQCTPGKFRTSARRAALDASQSSHHVACIPPAASPSVRLMAIGKPRISCGATIGYEACPRLLLPNANAIVSRLFFVVMFRFSRPCPPAANCNLYTAARTGHTTARC